MDEVQKVQLDVAKGVAEQDIAARAILNYKGANTAYLDAMNMMKLLGIEDSAKIHPFGGGNHIENHISIGIPPVEEEKPEAPEPSEPEPQPVEEPEPSEPTPEPQPVEEPEPPAVVEKKGLLSSPLLRTGAIIGASMLGGGGGAAAVNYLWPDEKPPVIAKPKPGAIGVEIW